MLIICILFALTLAGSLLGDAIAASTVIGMLTIGILVSMNMSYEKISAIIVMGACVGSIMPPITQALALASSLVGNPRRPGHQPGLCDGFDFVYRGSHLCGVFFGAQGQCAGREPRSTDSLADQTAFQHSAGQLEIAHSLLFLIVVVLLRTVEIPYLSVDLGPSILQSIRFLNLGGRYGPVPV